jgi:MoaA/NifB/PqqE/SkfB family radical SAM enzyme
LRVTSRIEAELPKLEKLPERVDRDAFDEPKCFDILLNYNCNAKCHFCSQDFDWRKVPNDLPFEKAVEHMYLAYKNGYRRLGFTGGEPTIRRELPNLIAIAKKIGYGYIRIQTNGVRIADFDYVKTLADAGLTFVKYSIHGHTAALHDELVGVPGAFDKCLKSIENLQKLRVGIGVNIVLNERNYRHLTEFYELFLLKLQLSNFVIIAPLYEGNMTLHALKGERIGAKITDMAPYIKRAYEVFTRINYPKPPLLLHFTPCILPGYEQQMLGWSAFNTMVVSPKGEKRDLDMTATAHTVKTDECKKCVYNDRCIGFDSSYARVFGTSEISPLLSVPERYDAGLRQQQGEGRFHEGRAILTDNEQCVLEVLKIKSPLTTKQFLALAEGIALCKDCKDENAVINAAETLIKMGLVERAFQKGRYVWSLKAEVPA